jgi:circadian clock protein KaiC
VRSVAIDLEPYVEAGLLRLESFTAGAAIADDFYLMIEDLVDEFRPVRVVIDPISALNKAGGSEIADSMVERLVLLFKARGLTAVFTAVSESYPNVIESTPTRVSTVADSWIHLSFAVQGGERNRSLTVVKSRGTGHSAQTREVLIDENGITLADVYASDGAVLFGTARLEREQFERAARLEESRSVARELIAIDEEKFSLEVRAQQVAQQIAHLSQRRGELQENARVVTAAAEAGAADIQQSRRADPEQDVVPGEIP